MSRILALDCGRKRTGVAATDTLRIVASGVGTVRTCDLEKFLAEYIASEPVDTIVIGEPRDLKGNPSESARFIEPVVNRLRKVLPPQIAIVRYDERFTSVLAHRAMLDGGLSRSARQDKALVDEISAVIILNNYLDSLNYRQ